MSKRKIFLASIITTATLSMVGCSGGGSSSSVAGTTASSVGNVVGTSSVGTSSQTSGFNTFTDLRIDGVPYYEARSDASGATPPNPPVINRSN
jgi:hypothetical protein